MTSNNVKAHCSLFKNDFIWNHSAFIPLRTVDVGRNLKQKWLNRKNENAIRRKDFIEEQKPPVSLKNTSIYLKIKIRPMMRIAKYDEEMRVELYQLGASGSATL